MVLAVEARLDAAKGFIVRLEAERELWHRAQLAVRADPRFQGFELPKIPGLTPLGADPDSGLQEFGHLLSGTQGQRDADGYLSPEEDGGLVLVLVPGGTARIGAQNTDPNAPHYDPDAVEDEFPIHDVELSPFLISKWEVTQAQWKRMSSTNPSRWHDRVKLRGQVSSLLHPVEQVSWMEATTVLEKYDLTLPTEVAWEYAARAGTEGPWLKATSASQLAVLDNIADRSYGTITTSGANFDRDAEDGYGFHAPVGSFLPNGFGLYDVLGNVFEWTVDRYQEYDIPPQPGRGERVTDSVSRSSSRQRTFRGGSHTAVARICRISRRSIAPEDARSSSIGVRPVRWLDPR